MIEFYNCFFNVSNKDLERYNSQVLFYKQEQFNLQKSWYNNFHTETLEYTINYSQNSHALYIIYHYGDDTFSTEITRKYYITEKYQNVLSKKLKNILLDTINHDSYWHQIKANGLKEFPNITLNDIARGFGL